MQIKEITRIRAEINEIENRKSIEKSKDTKIGFIEEINKIDKPLMRLTEKRRGRIQITHIRNEGTSLRIPWTLKG